MRLFKHALLALALASPVISTQANAASSSSSSSQQMEDLFLNIGIIYGKSDPKVASVLNALGINTAQDLRKFLKGDLNGSNFKDILSHLAFQYALKNPKAASFLKKLGVTDEASLNKFLQGLKDGSIKDTILQMALDSALSNPKYANWLAVMGITDIEDLKDILSGGVDGTNLNGILLMVAMNYFASNPKYEQYAPIVLAIIMTYFSNPSSDLSSVSLGVLDGLPSTEVKAVVKGRTAKTKL
jgi:ribosomal protein L12E/L44/L45/RPP1/RPP2